MSGSRWRPSTDSLFQPFFILTLGPVILFWIVEPVVGSGPVRSDDLMAHAVVVDLVRSGNVAGWDPLWLGGWPLFQFYPLGFHAIAAALSLPLGWMEDPSLVATLMLFALGQAMLPVSVYALARSFDPGGGHTNRRWQALLSVAAIGWWLLADGARLNTPLETQWAAGQAAEPLGWHLLLLFLAALNRINENWKGPLLAGLALAALVLVHMHTAVLAAGVAGGVGLLKPRSWLSWGTAGAWAVAMSAVFWLPFMAWQSDYTRAVSMAADVSLPLELFYVLSFSGGSALTDIAAVAVMAGLLLVGLTLGLAGPGRWRLLPWLLVWAALSGWIGTRDAINVLPAGLHLYRWLAPLMLMGLALAIPGLAWPLDQLTRRAPRMALALAISGVMVAVVGLGSDTRAHLAEQVVRDTREQQVVDYFQAHAPGARVLVERINPVLNEGDLTRGKHLISALHRSGIQTANGLFVQGAAHSGLLGSGAAALGIGTFGPPFAYPADDLAGLSDLTGFLDRHGVTHIVQARERPLARSLSGFELAHRIGSIAIHRRLGADPAPSARRIAAPLGLAVAGDSLLPLDAWLGARLNWPDHEWVLADPGHNAKLPFRGWLCEVDRPDCPKPRVLVSAEDLSKPRVAPDGDLERARYPQLSYALSQLDMDSLLSLPPSSAQDLRIPVKLGEDGSLAMTGLSPGSWWRLPYSHLPHFRIEGGLLFRSSAGMMVVWAEADRVTLSYRRGADLSTRWGLVITCLGLAGALWIFLMPARRQSIVPSP